MALVVMHVAGTLSGLALLGKIGTLLALAPLIGGILALLTQHPACKRWLGGQRSPGPWLLLLPINAVYCFQHLSAPPSGEAAFGTLPLAAIACVVLGNLGALRASPSRLGLMASCITLLLLVQLAIGQDLLRSVFVGLVFFTVWTGLGSRRAPAYANGQPGSPPSVTRAAGMSWRGLRFGAKIAAWTLLISCPMMIAFFFLFPRLPIDALKNARPQEQTSSTGLSDSLSLGSISELKKSQEPAFKASFRNEKPQSSSLYWRAVVLDRLDGQRWVSSAEDIGTRASAELMDVTGRAIVYQSLMEGGSRSPFVPILDGTNGKVFVAFEDQNVALFTRTDATVSVNAAVVRSATGQLNNVKPRIHSVIGTAHERFVLNTPTPNEMRQWLQLPAGFNPRTQAHGKALRARNGSPERVIESILKSIREEPYRYTLRPPALGPQAIDDFFLSTKAGFCEHYASAFVVLMRSAGIPARVVTGYLSAGVKDTTVAVSQGDAHAWTEVWLEDRGWVRQDPTAHISPSRVDPDATNALLESTPAGFWGFLDVTLRKSTFSAEQFWRNTMLDFDGQSQEDLFEKIGLASVGKPLLAVGMMVSMMAMAIFWQLGKTHWLIRARRSPGDALSAMLAKRCERAGVAPSIGQTWRSALAAAKASLSTEDFEELRGLVAEHERLIYGGAVETEPESLVVLSRRIRKFRPVHAKRAVSHVAEARASGV